MVQALVIRQAIRLADYALLALLGIIAYKGIVLVMGLDSNLAAKQSGRPPVEANFAVASVGPRSDYEAIIDSRMFGPAGEFGKPEGGEELPTETVETENETGLPLQLHGASAIVGLPTDPNASALISNAAAKTIDKDATYLIDDEIMEGVRLLEVYPRRVKIMNNNKTEWLSMASNAGAPSAGPRSIIRPGAPALSRSMPNTNVQDAKMVTLPQEETYQEMMAMDYAETIRQLRPQMKYDENDNVIGITSDYFSQIPLAEKTGFIDGDVITEVNGTPIDSQESVPDILIQEQNATSVRIRFERDGRPMVRTIRLE